MAETLSALLLQTANCELAEIRAVTETAAAIKPNGPESWSPKEELGHLIDSAANNHMRFVRAALEGEYHGPRYAQNDWVTLHSYHRMPWESIVSIWYQYNVLLAALVANIPENKLGSLCFIGSPETPETLGFIIDDYILHMQHHIDHLLQRQSITEYPRTAQTEASGIAV